MSDVVRALVTASETSGGSASVHAAGGRRPGAAVASELRDQRTPAVVVLHGVFTPCLAQARRELRRALPGVPLIAFPHDAYDAALFSSRTLLKQAYFAAVERPYLRRVDRVLLTADRHLADLRRHGVGTPTTVVPLGLPLGSPGGSPHHRRAGPLRALVLGRWDVWDKGLDTLLTAVGGDDRLRRGLTLRLVGPEQGARARLTKLARESGADVELVGWVDDPAQELMACDTVLLPSRKEGFGLSGLQALAAGRPLLLSSVAGLMDYVGPADGVVVVTPTVTGVAGGLHRLLDDADRLSARAEAFAAARLPEFSWDRLLDALLVTSSPPPLLDEPA